MRNCKFNTLLAITKKRFADNIRNNNNNNKILSAKAFVNPNENFIKNMTAENTKTPEIKSSSHDSDNKGNTIGIVNAEQAGKETLKNAFPSKTAKYSRKNKNSS